MRLVKVALAAGLLLLVALPGLWYAKSTTIPKTTLIRGGLVVDGTGAPGAAASVRILDDKILEVGDLSPLRDETVIDGTGLIVAPGFVDVFGDEHLGSPQAALTQGITTVFSHDDAVLRQEDRGAPPLNAGFFASGEPFATGEAEEAHLAHLRSTALGIAHTILDASEQETVLQLMAQQAAANDRPLLVRLRTQTKQVWDDLERVLAAAGARRARLHLVQLGLHHPTTWKQTNHLIARLEKARDSGLDISADFSPYEFRSSTVEELVPEGQTERRALSTLLALLRPEYIWFASSTTYPTFVGHSLAEVATEQQSLPVSLLGKVIATEKSLEQKSVLALRQGAPSDLSTLMAWNQSFPATGRHGGFHPARWGTFVHTLSQFVDSEHLVSREEAIRRMTSLPVERFGIPLRGRVRAGYFADLVLLDPNELKDAATFRTPEAPAKGIVRVWVNGQVAYENGTVTPVKGSILVPRRSPLSE